MSDKPTFGAITVLTIAIIVVSCAALAVPPLPVITLLADSQQYAAMSDAIFSGSFFQPLDISNRSQLASTLRPPLFPLLLGAAQRIPGIHTNDALIIIHLVIGCIIIATTPWILRGIIPPPLTALASGVALFSTKQVAYGAMSEWLAMALIFMCVVSYLSWRMNQTWIHSVAPSTLLSLAILTRTALLPWLALIPFMLLQTNRGKRMTTATAIALGLLPLAAWATVNFIRLDSFTLGKYEGLNLLATARSLGPIPLTREDIPEAQKVLDYINQNGITPSAQAFAPGAIHQWGSEYYAAFHKNFDTSCDAVVAYATTTPPRAAALAARSFTAHQDTYRAFLLGGWHTFSRDYAPLIVLCLVANLWLWHRRPTLSLWTSSVTTVCALTLLYLGSIFSTMLWLHRYIMPIQPALMFCTIVTLGLLVTSFNLPRDPTTT